MKVKSEIIPISRVFSIIDSCINTNQLEVCKKVALQYENMAIRNGVLNISDLRDRLECKIEEKKTEIEYIDEFLN